MPRHEMRHKLVEMNGLMGAERVSEDAIENALDRLYGKSQLQRQPSSLVVDKARDQIVQAKLRGIG